MNGKIFAKTVVGKNVEDRTNKCLLEEGESGSGGVCWFVLAACDMVSHERDQLRQELAGFST